jgi:hypothetical protein
MDELGAALCRIAEFLDGQRMDAPAAPVSRFEDRHALARAPELAGSDQTRGACADDHDMAWR